MEGPLSGVKVVELAMWVAGPSAAAVLGDWGADVVKLEDPGTGDPIRAIITHRTDSRTDVAAAFQLDNRNKRSVAVNLRRPEGIEFAARIIGRSDVFITGLRIETLRRMKLDYASLYTQNPRLVYAALTGYGHRGPECNRAGFDYGAAWARTGLMATMAEPGQAPPAQRPGMFDHAAGLALAGAISAALFRREKTGRGTAVRSSLFQVGLWMNATDLTLALLSGTASQPETRLEGPNPLWNRYRCKDGAWIYFVMLQPDKFWPAFCEALSHLEWKDDPRFCGFWARLRNTRALTEAIDSTIATRTRAEWALILDRHELVWAPVQSDAEVLQDEQAKTLGTFVEIEHPSLPGCRLVDSPIEFGSEHTRSYTAAPELGAHTEEVALEAGFSWEEIVRLKEAGVLG